MLVKTIEGYVAIDPEVIDAVTYVPSTDLFKKIHLVTVTLNFSGAEIEMPLAESGEAIALVKKIEEKIDLATTNVDETTSLTKESSVSLRGPRPVKTT